MSSVKHIKPQMNIDKHRFNKQGINDVSFKRVLNAGRAFLPTVGLDFFDTLPA
jgi:hypothetical protein